MIPEKDTKVGKSESLKEKYGAFALFDVEHFLRRILKKLVLVCTDAVDWICHFLGI